MSINAFARVPVRAILLIVLVYGAPVAFAADRLTSDVKITSEGKLTEGERRALSVATARMLHHVDRARKDIEKRDAGAAVKNVEQALTLIRIIDETVPETHVATTIKSKSRTYQGTETVKPLLVRLYSQMDEFIDLESSPEKSKEIGLLKKLAPWPILREGRGLTTVFFQVGDAKFRIEAALEELKRHDLTAADNSLTGLQHDVVIFHRGVDMPLERVRLRLLDASRQATKHELAAARESLRSAIGALQDYAREHGGQVSRKTSAMISQMRELQKKLEQGGKDVQEEINRLLNMLFPVERRKDSERSIEF